MAKAQLTTITPVHVGSGTAYQKDIHFLRTGNRIGLIDPEKIAERVPIDEALIEAWVKAIEKRESILSFLSGSRGINLKLEEICSRLMEVKGVSSLPAELKEHYRTPLKGVCIPGSSLKGAIRTAVVDFFTDERFMQNLVESDLKDKRGQWSSATVTEKLFGRDPKEQSTRFLKVGDIHFAEPKTEVREVKILSLKQNGFEAKSGSHLFEVIPPGSESAAFQIKIDSRLLEMNRQKLPLKWPDRKVSYLTRPLADFAALLDGFTRDILSWEVEMLHENYFDDHPFGANYLEVCNRILNTSSAEGEAVLRVGGHSGWLFTTGAWVRKDTPLISDNAKKMIKKAVQKNKEYPFNLWPKTRKVSTLGEPFGFVKIKLSEE